MQTSFHSYTLNYDNPILRGEEEKRPWELLQIIKGLGSINKSLLDIGCGTASKLIQIAPSFGKVIGIEPNPNMYAQAVKKITEYDLTHVRIIEGYAHRLPVKNENFDIVTAMMSAQEVIEIYRVLKSGGYAVIETSGEQDKQFLKEFFIDYKNQPRGQLSYLPYGSIRKFYYEMFNSLFQEVTIKEGWWNSYLTWEGLVELLTQTPIIRNFDILKDLATLENAAETLRTDRGIRLTHHRVLIIAKK